MFSFYKKYILKQVLNKIDKNAKKSTFLIFCKDLFISYNFSQKDFESSLKKGLRHHYFTEKENMILDYFFELYKKEMVLFNDVSDHNKEILYKKINHIKRMIKMDKHRRHNIFGATYIKTASLNICDLDLRFTIEIKRQYIELLIQTNNSNNSIKIENVSYKFTKKLIKFLKTEQNRYLDFFDEKVKDLNYDSVFYSESWKKKQLESLELR